METRLPRTNVVIPHVHENIPGMEPEEPDNRRVIYNVNNNPQRNEDNAAQLWQARQWHIYQRDQALANGDLNGYQAHQQHATTLWHHYGQITNGYAYANGVNDL